jgi:2-polyprenyl-3-methyl-5-hydroxy-6-metoxy-1,4-benzoquinol methylase
MERYAANGVHGTVIQCMAAIALKGDVLDIPTGQGALAKDMEGLGFRVFPADLASDNIAYRNGRCAQIDLSEPLPVKDEVMDCVVCVEGIEHLENPFFAIREFARVLKTGGRLIITTPNVMSINSRIRFLLYSYLEHFKHFGPLPEEAKHGTIGYEHGHLTPVSYPQMRHMLERYGLTIERIEASRRVKRWPILHSLLKPVIRYKTSRRYRDSFYLSDVLLEGEVLIFVAMK